MTDSLKNLLAGLQKTYLASIPEKIQNLRTLWENGRLEELHTEYHKLKGTGRTYGLPEVSRLGETLEILCERKPESLPTTVPLSLQLFERIRIARENGAIHELEEDPDFQAIAQLLSVPGSTGTSEDSGDSGAP